MNQLALQLTDQERVELSACEAVIERGLKTFVEVGEALLKIKKDRLFREEHRTFEDYCRERWDFRHSRRAQLIEAAQIVHDLKGSTIVELPANEGQTRELVPLRGDTDRMAAAWREAVDTAPNGKVTAEHVREVVREYQQPDSRPTPQPAEVWTPEERELQGRLQDGETVVVSFRCHQNLIAWAQDLDLFVRIDRQSDWGNPFRIGRDGDRAEVIAKYRDHFLLQSGLVHQLDELQGKALGCWCAPEPCHGDVLAIEVGGDS